MNRIQYFGIIPEILISLIKKINFSFRSLDTHFRIRLNKLFVCDNTQIEN